MNFVEAVAQENSDIEIQGSMLVGLVQALKNVHVLCGEKVACLVKNIESTAWYPMAIFFQLLNDLGKFEIDSNPILFQAGAYFARDWFKNDGNRTFIRAADFLRIQGNSAGYAMVHRGDREKIGWLDLVELDESVGYAKLVCVTPYPSEFERGLFYYGIYLSGDVDYVEIDTAVERYNANLSKKTHTIRFHKKTDKKISESLNDFLAKLSLTSPITIPEELQEAMVWRLKALEDRYEHDRCFNEQSGLLLSKAANQICLLSEHLDKLAHRDSLTDTLNRRAIFEGAQNFLSLGARNGSPVGFIMVDIDHFKTINDTWGHEAGDEVLCSVTTALGNNIRDSDLLGRVGGEEFLIVLPETSLDDACIVAEKLRIAVEQQGLPGKYQSNQPLTISIGVSSSGTDAAGARLSYHDYIRRADHALYQSKQNGRNRVTAFSG